jgi:hypothetical protein
MPDKTKRSEVGQAWLAQRVGVTPYSALIMILLPRKPFVEDRRLKAVYKTTLFEREKGWRTLDSFIRLPSTMQLC